MKKIIQTTYLIILCAAAYADNDDLAVFVNAGDTQGLITAIENGLNGSGPDLIFVRPGANGETTFTFTEPYMGGSSALPNITGLIEIFPIDSLQSRITFARDLNAPQMRLFEVSGTGNLGLGTFNIESFSITGNGGAIFATGNTRVSCRGVSFSNNFASGEGGAIYMGGDSQLFCRGTGRLSAKGPGIFRENRAGTLGGAISLQDNATANLSYQVFADNQAGIFGCDLNVNSASNANFGNTLSLSNSTFAADCDNVLFENPRGRMRLNNNSFAGRGDAIDSTGLSQLFGNLLGNSPTSNFKAQSVNKALCNDFGTNAFDSLGYNIANANSCNLDQSTDLPNTDPRIVAPDADDVIALQAASPAIDAGATHMQANPDGPDILPCGYVDSRGLGRPQDANGDGVFECDMGSYEVQGGPDLTIAQSGLYFDTGRNGEGVRVEMLGGGAVLVAMFTYDPNGNDLMWLVGVGQQVGNSIVVDELFRTTGGAFGSAFDPAAINNELAGSLSMVFPDCAATNRPGRLVFESIKRVSSPLDNLLVEASTITRLLSCSSQMPFSNKAGRSGAFFDANRSGEGIFIDVINDQTAVIFFYTFTPSGEQFWILGSGGVIQGDTITAQMVYPSSTTAFGSQFNQNEVVLSNWGTLTLTHQAGCNSLIVNYSSSVSGFGSGNFNYTRLSQPAGTTCDL